MRRIVIAAATALISAAALAADKSAAATGPEWENGGDIYGFSDNPDTPGKTGVANVKLGWIALRGKRFGGYDVVSTTLESEYGLTDWLSVTPAVTFGWHRLSNVPLTLTERQAAAAGGSTDRNDYFLPNRDRFSASAVALGFKWRIIERGKATNGKVEGSPIGFGMTFEPKYAGVDDGTGNRLKVFSFATAAIVDTALIPERLFLAGNLGLEMSRGRDLYTREAKRDSKVSLSTALSYQFAPGWFAGIEARHERAFAGVTFRQAVGHATYLGPTFFAKFGNWGVQAAWNAQIAGKAKDEPGQKLDLANFERHRARLRLSYDF